MYIDEKQRLFIANTMKFFIALDASFLCIFLIEYYLNGSLSAKFYYVLGETLVGFAVIKLSKQEKYFNFSKILFTALMTFIAVKIYLFNGMYLSITAAWLFVIPFIIAAAAEKKAALISFSITSITALSSIVLVNLRFIDSPTPINNLLILGAHLFALGIGFYISIIRFFAFYQLSQDRLEQMLIKEKEVNQTKNRFLATISHELRTPLNGIYGIFQILESELPNQRELIQTGIKSTRALNKVLSDILDIQKSRQGKISIKNDWYSSREFFENIISLYISSAQNKGLRLTHENTDNLPDELFIDELHLGQIVTNLISNAIKFTEEGGVTLSCSIDNKKLQIQVSDTGIGIPKDSMNLLFETFSQVDDSSTRKFGGTGLGLKICKDLVDLMDGSISVSSDEGVGSTFIVEIPVESRFTNEI
jgi:signal transduction histidine kinase